MLQELFKSKPAQASETATLVGQKPDAQNRKNIPWGVLTQITCTLLLMKKPLQIQIDNMMFCLYNLDSMNAVVNKTVGMIHTL
jgi:hypothetical protein